RRISHVLIQHKHGRRQRIHFGSKMICDIFDRSCFFAMIDISFSLSFFFKD
ncbi:hypothetical protein EUTSA_v10029271mg, partial [Eutrema salsugineum]